MRYNCGAKTSNRRDQQSLIGSAPAPRVGAFLLLGYSTSLQRSRQAPLKISQDWSANPPSHYPPSPSEGTADNGEITGDT